MEITIDSYKTACREYLDASAEAKAATARKDAASKTIKEYHKQTNSGLLCEDGVQTTITESVRKSLDAALVAEHLKKLAEIHGFTLTAEDADLAGCYKKTTVKTLNVKPLVVEGKAVA